MITDRDLELARWVGRVGVARTTDLAARFDMGRTAAYRRVKELVDQGLVERHRILHADDGLLMPTTRGLRAAGLESLRKPVVRLDQLEHAILVAQFIAHYEPRLRERVLLTERELIAAEAEAGNPIGSSIQRSHDGFPRFHRPDIVVGQKALQTDLVAIEIERSVKQKSRLDAILKGYLRNPNVAAVHYWATAPAAKAVQGAVKRVGVGELVTIHELKFEQ